MNAAKSCWGIYRELAHSPGRIDDDGAILKSVGGALAERGFCVELVAADDADGAFETPHANIFAMCERGAVIDRLKAAEKAGSIVVNSPDAIHNTYRHRMIQLFARHHVSAPASQIVATDASKLRPAAGVWVKRYDFHATQPDDVIYTASEDGWHEALRRFAKRGIPFIVGQEHIAGDLIKFYGLRDGALPMDQNWFEWFYHRDKGMVGHSFEVSYLRQVAIGAAAALGLEIFGGDAIIQADGEPIIIDLNAWPSYARYRDQATRAIADCLTERFRRRPRVVTQS